MQTILNQFTKAKKIYFLKANWQCNVERTQEVELVIAEVQGPDSRWCTYNKKTSAGWAQHATSSLCLKGKLEDHWASNITFSTQLRKSEANYKLYPNFDCWGLVLVLCRSRMCRSNKQIFWVELSSAASMLVGSGTAATHTENCEDVIHVRAVICSWFTNLLHTENCRWGRESRSHSHWISLNVNQVCEHEHFFFKWTNNFLLCKGMSKTPWYLPYAFHT